MILTGRAEPLSEQGLLIAAESLDVAPEKLWTVVTVETRGFGFLPDRRPVVLFERHEFRRRTRGKFNATHPAISGEPGNYGPEGANQLARLARAMALDQRAALESASWGLGQIMGYNASLAGYSGVEDMVAQFRDSEDAHLAAMARFIRDRGLHVALQRSDWVRFAEVYNGRNYKANSYHTKLAASEADMRSRGLPDFTLRAAQMMLSYESLNVGPIDGRMGPRTRDAITRFRVARGIGAGDSVDPELLDALRSRQPGVSPDPAV